MATTVTKTVKPSGGDYTSLSAFEAGEQRDLVSADEIAQAECYAMSDTTPCLIDGWTVDSTRYIHILIPTAERHDGKWNTSKYRLDVSSTGGNSYALNNQMRYTHIQGIQAKLTMSANAHYYSNCILLGNYSGSQSLSDSVVVGYSVGLTDCFGFSGVHAAYNFDGAPIRNKVWNVIAYGFRERGGYGAGGAKAFNIGESSYIYNCTAYDSSTGFIEAGYTSTVPVLKNCLAQDCATCFSGTWGSGTAYNCSDDATQPGTSGQNGEVTFVNEGSGDYHLDAGDTVAKDNGVDLSADGGLAFSTDIDAQTRSGSWDIGADEYVAAGGGGSTTGEEYIMITS